MILHNFIWFYMLKTSAGMYAKGDGRLIVHLSGGSPNLNLYYIKQLSDLMTSCNPYVMKHGILTIMSLLGSR